LTSDRRLQSGEANRRDSTEDKTKNKETRNSLVDP
jgi:hypothetical protein